MEEAMQAKITELKKRQEALRKGLENLAKDKQVQNTEIVRQINVNTTQLDSSSIQELINTIMPQDDLEEGCSGSSGAKGPDEEAGSDSSQDVTLPIDSESDLSAEEGGSGAKGPDEGAGSDSSQDVILPINSESDLSAEESGSGAKDHDEEAESEQGDIPHSDGDNDLSDPGSEEDGSDNDDGSESSSDEGDRSPSRKRAKMD